jgi:hypothetical protein
VKKLLCLIFGHHLDRLHEIVDPGCMEHDRFFARCSRCPFEKELTPNQHHAMGD